MAVGALTERQQEILSEYLRTGSVRNAAAVLGLSVSRVQDVVDAKAEEIAEARRLALGKLAVTADSTVGALAGIAFAEDEETKDRLKALELLGKYQGLFVERHKHEGTVSITVADPYADGGGE